MALIVKEFQTPFFKDLASIPFELANPLFKLLLPAFAKVLSCELCKDTNILRVFAEIDTEEDTITEREFAIVETGKGLPEEEHSGWMFMSTVAHFPLAYHVYLRVV